MVPVILIIIFWWAGSGAVASVKAARAASAERDRVSAAANSNGAPRASGNSRSGRMGNATAPQDPNLGTNARRRPSSSDVTFGQWQASMFRRWKLRVRSHLPGQRLGRRAVDLIGDVTAATLAGGAIFGMGFISGTTWMGSRWATHHTRSRTQRPSPAQDAHADNETPERDPSHSEETPFAWTNDDFFDLGRLRNNTNTDDVVDAEIVGDPDSNPQTSPSRYAGDEYADVVLPELTATNPTITTAPNGHAMAAEILTVHHLLRWAQGAFEHAANVIEQSAVRARSALDRASHALVRSNTATARRDTAVAVADTAQQHAAQLEATAARFSTLRMDPASMTSIGVGITTAVGLAQAEQRRAEAEAEVARWSTGLAAAEQTAAEAAQASAQAAAVHAEAVRNMHDTVRRHQMPHAEALAATGNDAAHPSVLAAG